MDALTISKKLRFPAKIYSSRQRPCKRAYLSAAIFLAPFYFYSATLYADAPVAIDDARIIPINTRFTLNLLANDFDPDGDAIILIEASQPDNGTISINADGSVLYTPNTDFAGTDSFTYTIQEQADEQLTATASVTLTIRNSELRPFANTDNSASLADSMSRACDSLRSLSDAALGDNGRALLARCGDMEELAAANPDAVEETMKQIAPEEAMLQMQVAANSNRTQTQAVSQRISQLRAAASSNISINGIAFSPSHPLADQRGGGASAEDSNNNNHNYNGLLSKLGLFASFQLENADREKTARESGYQSSANTVTVGADYFANNKWIVGTAFSYTQNNLDYANNGGNLDAQMGTLFIFSSYLYKELTWDLQLGYSGTAFESARRIRYQSGDSTIDQTARSSTEGSQLLLSSQVQWLWSNDALTLYPMLRFDYQKSHIKGFGETGTSGLQMILGEQNITQSTLSAGVQTTYAFNMPWGILIPMVDAIIFTEIKTDRDELFARFAYDPDPDNNFALVGDNSEQHFAQLGLGTSAVFKGGLSAYFEYQKLVGYEHLNSYKVQLGLRYEM